MFQPVVPLSGLAGWRFLQRTYDAQFETFSASAALKRDSDHFRENIGKVTSAEELVSDRRLLSVALGAFGLQDDIDNRYFIRKVLEEGTLNDDALANRFANPRYKEMAEAFGFGTGEVLKVGESSFAGAIIDRYQTAEFEVAAGNQDESMRIALYAQRKVTELAGSAVSNDTMWYSVMGDPPLRELFEKALNLPSSFGQIDLDQQLSVLKHRAQSTFGTAELSDFSDADLVQDLITKFVVRDQIADLSTGLSSTSIALTLLQG